MDNSVKTMESHQLLDIECDTILNEKLKLKQLSQDHQMTSSTISSLASPGDSGVQLLDSESEITSMISSGSGIGCSNSDNEITVTSMAIVDEEKVEKSIKYDVINRKNEKNSGLSKSVPSYFDRFEHKFELEGVIKMAQSDKRSKEMFNQSLSDEVFEMEHPIKNLKEKQDTDSMNISLNSYELLDYTLQNKNINIDNEEMHVSMSEEVNENLKINPQPEQLQQQQDQQKNLPIVENIPENVVKPVEEQIVFRRQRKKKSKSDTPKKRVSFHEDILNSTKIDDIHINHGFITHEPDVSLSFFQRTFIRKPDVVKGRYSWAAEGDAPYYEKSNNREIKSDLYINNNNNPRLSSTSSSSSSGSLSSSSIDEDDENFIKKEPTFKQPKSSCLKKTTNRTKKLDTNIVEEEVKKRKRSDSNLLDSNIFGSLKNILSFSTSVPLAERGVPEGQEDFNIYSTSHDSYTSNHQNNKKFINIEKPVKNPKAYNLKLTTSEGFYPNYPTINQNLPSNIILCDSNVYEHKGISYSYEYDKFQKSFERDHQEKPKSSTIYQMILNELNFWRKKSKQETINDDDDDNSIVKDFEVIPPSVDQTNNKHDSIEEVEEIDDKNTNTVNKYATTTKLDWSDNETISDLSIEQANSRHLNSPKKRINKTNHYSLSPFKLIHDSNGRNDDKSANNSVIASSSTRSSLINRFLRNVTLKKMLEIKAQCKQRNSFKYLDLHVKGAKFVYQGLDDYDRNLEQEILQGRENLGKIGDVFDKKLTIQLKKEIFRDRLERLVGAFPVRSAYTTNGNSKSLLVVLTDTTLYIVGVKSSPTSGYCNHFVLPYTELNTIVTGPNYQTIHFSNYDKDMQCLITTGCSKITNNLIGQLEFAMRRDLNKPKLPAVKQLGMRDMMNLRRAICKQTSVDKDEEYYYYSIVNIQDFNPDSVDLTPLGPNKEGPLMFKTSEIEARWETAYFILKAGVLYMLSSASQRVPMRVFPLINGSCQGARRIYNYPRPHTFQLTIEGKILHLAAPDEYVASDWLQCLVHAASGAYNNRERILTQSCSLFMTSEHILTVREAFPCTIPSLLPYGKNQHEPIKGAQVLSCAAIVDLVSFRLPSAEQSWCVLEFACREVHECSGDWILYFATNSELEYFISTLEVLWTYVCENGDSFPLSTIPETDPLSKKCVDIYMSLKNSWPSTNTVHLQFI